MKEQNPYQIVNSQSQKLENKDEILKVYARYYEELLKIRPQENVEEEAIERKVDKKFQEIIAERKANWEVVTRKEILKAIKGMKKKSGDRNNWKVE